ncbi:hypothetical protein [Nostoc sp. TCL26-01]|uniref:hypothetical protein n=1 Tax=Nostoc sp. TCL26-01 TaxID=2576904 RepID=UPI0015C0EE84|nr:hypothetical protein [Nostoc sp. TCL26-01]QLE54895.1 hypothetical protein FD725_04785 [Nostoc sp. TCL26-01]
MTNNTRIISKATIYVITISLISSINLLRTSTSVANPINEVVTATQTKQLRPTRLTAKEISQVKRTLTGQKPILDQAFRVNLPDFGSCVFLPVQEFSQKTKKNRLTLYLVKNDKIVYTFPQSQQVQSWNFSSLKAVSFLELHFDDPNEDGILLISNYTTGSSANSRLFPVVTLYNREEKGFTVYEDISKKLTTRRVKTIAEAEKILRNEFNFLP